MQRLCQQCGRALRRRRALSTFAASTSLADDAQPLAVLYRSHGDPSSVLRGARRGTCADLRADLCETALVSVWRH